MKRSLFFIVLIIVSGSYINYGFVAEGFDDTQLDCIAEVSHADKVVDCSECPLLEEEDVGVILLKRMTMDEMKDFKKVLERLHLSTNSTKVLRHDNRKGWPNEINISEYNKKFDISKDLNWGERGFEIMLVKKKGGKFQGMNDRIFKELRNHKKVKRAGLLCTVGEFPLMLYDYINIKFESGVKEEGKLKKLNEWRLTKRDEGSFFLSDQTTSEMCDFFTSLKSDSAVKSVGLQIGPYYIVLY